MMALQDAARFKGLLGNTPNPSARGLRPPTDAERARLDVTNPEMPLNDLARARLEAERPFNPGSTTLYTPDNPNYYTGGTPETMDDYYRRTGTRLNPDGTLNDPRPLDPQQVAEEFFRRRREMNLQLPPPEFANNPDGTPYTPPAPRTPGPSQGGSVPVGPELDYGRFPYTPPAPIPPVGGEMAADPEPEEYDGFVDSGTGQRGFMGDKYMPTPMDTSVAMAQAAPPVANTAYNAPLVANTAYNAPPVANTAYMPPPTDAPVNTAYMPSRRTVPVDTTYRPPTSANTTYMPSPSPSYGMSTTPTYNMSTSTTPTYGTSNGGQIREPSYSPNQAGKYKVDGPRLRNTGGLFNDLNAFFGRPQT